MATALIIARHGNTFAPGAEPRRVGGRTDLPLVASGRAQARALGLVLGDLGLAPERVLCAPLKRTRETAAIALRAAGWRLPLATHPLLTEIDHGPDENQPEAAVLARIGPAALRAWEEDAAPPPGWRVHPADLRRRWRAFADSLTGTTLVVTSNGIARFAPAAGGKLATGAFGVIVKDGGTWHCAAWNVRPPPRGRTSTSCPRGTPWAGGRWTST